MTTEDARQMRGLVDEVLRLHGRLVAVNVDHGAAESLTGAEVMVLRAVVNAERSPTVPQIGRSLGHARQSVQRVANALTARGLLALKENPDHKRAPLLIPTEAGRAAHSRVHQHSQAWTRRVTEGIEPGSIGRAAETLRALRVRMEADLAAKRPAG